MKQRTLLGQLLIWQVIVAGAACVVLVVGAILVSGTVVRRTQDATLGSLADTLCSGIQHEYAERGRKLDLRSAAAHFFEEAFVEDHQFEMRDRSGSLMAQKGDYGDLPVEDPGESNGPGCASRQIPGDWLRPDTVVRICRRVCSEQSVLWVATVDQLRTPAVRSALLAPLAALPFALLLGALFGWLTLRRLLRPIRQLEEATSSVSIGPGMTLGVGARTRELSRLELAFDDLLRRISLLLEREKRFAREASHELRTPLTRLQLRLERMQERCDRASDLETEIQAALGSVKSLDRLTDSLLTLSRSESAEMPVEPVNICDLAREAATGHGEQESTAASPVLGNVPDEILVRGNEELLGRAVANLVENAQKYAGAQACIRLDVHAENGCGVIAVEDDGPGIPPDVRRIAFERFSRGPAQRSKVPGSGLGLSVVDAIVRRHGGRVETGRSELGGERVRIFIPLLRQAT